MNENLSPQVLKYLSKELKAISAASFDGIVVHVNQEDLTDFQATIDGPEGTPFEGGRFRMRLAFGSDFPAAPPRGYFVTKIFHPNVAPDGEICVNLLKRDWSPSLGLRQILITIRCLLIEPNPESALNEEAARLQLQDFESFQKHARLMTSVHAMKNAPTRTGCETAPSQKPRAQADKKKKSLRRL